MQTEINFLREKIGSLRTAIFYNYSHADIRLNPSVIEIDDIDENGNITFYLTKPFGDISGLDKIFPAHLHCYRKGAGYTVDVHGRATLAASADNRLFITVKILFAELNKLNAGRNNIGSPTFMQRVARLFKAREAYSYNLN